MSIKLSPGISGAVALIYSSLLHVIHNCVVYFNSAKICRSDYVFNSSILLDQENPGHMCILYNFYMVSEHRKLP